VPVERGDRIRMKIFRQRLAGTPVFAVSFARLSTTRLVERRVG
jgi:hypothetical protein